MKRAYVDTSCFVALAFGERGAAGLRRQLVEYDQLLSSNLLEAELRAALRKEEVSGATSEQLDLLAWVDWVLPSRPLSGEFQAALQAGYLRGTDLWHVATALYVAPTPGELSFLTLDERQRDVAKALGFAM